MHKHTIRNVAVIGTLSLVLALAIVPRTFAKDAVTTQPTTGRETTLRETDNTDDNTSESPEAVSRDDARVDALDRPDDSERKEVPDRLKLEDRKKRVCEEKAPQINRAMNNVIARTDKHAAQILKFYTLTKEFYTNNNLSIANYDALVGSVEATRLTADAAQETLTTHPTFTCDSDGPKADIQVFKNQRVDKVSAFTDYRKAVREFIKAVRAAAVTANVDALMKEEKK